MIGRQSVPSWMRILLFLSLTVIYTASFWKNAFYAVDHWWFSTHQLDSEALVIGRLVETERNGMSSYQGRLGTHSLTIERPPEYITNEGFLYYNEGARGHFWPYDSQIGLQGIFFSSIDQLLHSITDMSGEERRQALHFVASLLTAIFIAMLLYVIFIEFGLFVCIVTAAISLYFQWMVVFGKNLYWAMFLIYAPGAISFYLYSKHRDTLRYNLLIFTSIAIAVLLKCFSGFEYLTTIVISALCPIVYFGVVRRWRYVKIFRHTLLVCSASTFAFVITFFAHVFHQSLGQGLSFGESLGIRLNHALYRLHKPVNDAANTVWTAASEASTLEVVGKYWNGQAVNLDYALGNGSFPSISFSAIVLLVAALMPLIFISERYSPSIHKYRRRLFGLTAIVWLSFAGTLSWYVFAKVHSYFHGHMNHVLWHIPFTFFAVAYIAFIAQCLLVDLANKIEKGLTDKFPGLPLRRKVLCSAAAVVLIIIVALYINGIHRENMRSLAEVRDQAYLISVAENGLEVFVLDGQIAYYHPSCTALDLKQRFFLHVYPGGGNGRREAVGFDFNWRERAIYQPGPMSLGNGSCLAIVTLPENINIRAIRTGQFIPSGKRTWSQYIDVRREVNADQLSAANVTDERWIRGVSVDGKRFIVENAERYRNLLTAEKVLIFPDFSVRSILEAHVAYGYIQVSVAGPPINSRENGFPGPILVINP